MQAAIRGEDLLVLLALVASNEDADVARARLGASPEAFEESLRRCARAELYAAFGKRVRRPDLLGFLLHGVRHVFPAEFGERPVMGVPTSLSAEPLRGSFVRSEGAEVVWPHPGGTLEGTPLTPLEPSLPEIAVRWPELHRLAALVDALRAGRSRERQAARAGITQVLAA